MVLIILKHVMFDDEASSLDFLANLVLSSTRFCYILCCNLSLANQIKPKLMKNKEQKYAEISFMKIYHVFMYVSTEVASLVAKMIGPNTNNSMKTKLHLLFVNLSHSLPCV